MQLSITDSFPARKSGLRINQKRKRECVNSNLAVVSTQFNKRIYPFAPNVKELIETTGIDLFKELGVTHITSNYYTNKSLVKNHSEEVDACYCIKKKSKTNDTRQSINCEYCINKDLFIECSPELCPCNELCQNQRIRRNQESKVEIFKTVYKGYGIRSLENINSSDIFIFEYVGEVISSKNYMKRIKACKANNDSDYYFFQLDNDRIIDAKHYGNKSRFINHSCDPNCYAINWISNNDIHLAVFSKTPIAKGQELTIDYGYDTTQTSSIQQKCFCQSYNCSGIIGKKLKN